MFGIKVDSPPRPVTPKAAMSMWDGFIYNFLAMGVIFPWVYMWGPAAFPGANISLAILLAFCAQVPLSAAYSFMSAAVPENGGDYVYQKMAFGKIGTIAVLSGFVIWILQWVALSGWLFATLGLAPVIMSFSVAYNSPWLLRLAVVLESPGGVILVTWALCIGSILLLKRGLGTFAKVQRLLFALTVLGVCVMAIVFLQPEGKIFGNLNSFVGAIAGHLNLLYPRGMTNNFVEFLQQNVIGYGFNPQAGFSFLATLRVVPIAWTGLQWATYSVQQNADIEGSQGLANQLTMLLGSAAAVAVVLIMVAYLEGRAFGQTFLTAISRTYWAETNGAPEAYRFIRKVLQPFPNVLAIASSGSRSASVVIVLGFLANAFQVTCNCFIGMGKILVRMNEDGLFPRSWRLGELTRAYWVYFVSAIPVIIGYSLVSEWSDYTLGVTFAGGYVFMLSALAIAKLSSRPDALRRYPVRGIVSTRTMKISAGIGSLLALSMVVSYLLIPELGLRNKVAYCVVSGVIIGCALWVLLYRGTKRPLVESS